MIYVTLHYNFITFMNYCRFKLKDDEKLKDEIYRCQLERDIDRETIKLKSKLIVKFKERMSLKHKNTSKWSKAQNRYAKYSDRAREQVQEQLEISKQLTKKLKPMQKDQDSDEEPNNNIKNANQTDKDINLGELLTNSNGLLENNPWMRMMGDVGLIKSTNDLNKDDSLLSQD